MGEANGNESDSKALTVEVFTPIGSIWSFFGASEFQRIVKQYDIKPVLTLSKLFPENGSILNKDRPVVRQKYWAVEIKRWAKRRGIPVVEKPKFGNQIDILIPTKVVLRAQLKWGHSDPRLLPLLQKLQSLLWVEDKNAADVENLREALKSFEGVEEGEVEQLLGLSGDEEREREVVELWEKNAKSGQERGLFGAPTYIVNGELFWGQDRLDFVEERIQELIADGYKSV